MTLLALLLWVVLIYMYLFSNILQTKFIPAVIPYLMEASSNTSSKMPLLAVTGPWHFLIIFQKNFG
jgi:hypothetical protein